MDTLITARGKNLYDVSVVVDSGKADFGAAGMTVTPDRAENVNFTDTYCTGIQVVIVKDTAAE